MYTALKIPAGRRPLTRGEIGGSIVFLGIFAGLLAFGLLRDFKPANASVLFFLIFWGVMLVVHELGHAVAAWICGWRVGEISIGFGPDLLVKRIGKTTLRVRLFPLEGFVRPAPDSTHWGRTKMAFIYFAGPGAELLVLAGMVLVLGWGGVFNDSDEYGPIAIKALAVVILMGAGLNLVPFPTSGGVSDGLGILTSGLLKPEALEDYQYSLERREVERLLVAGKSDEARRIVEQLRQTFSKNRRLALLEAKVMLANEDPEQAISHLERSSVSAMSPNHAMNENNKASETSKDASSQDPLTAGVLETSMGDSAWQSKLQIEIARTRLYCKEPDYRALDNTVKEFGKVTPQCRVIKVIKGCSMVLRGYTRSGGNLLATTFQEIADPDLDPLILGFLAIAAHQDRNSVAVQRFYESFQSYPAPCYLVKMVERKLAS